MLTVLVDVDVFISKTVKISVMTDKTVSKMLMIVSFFPLFALPGDLIIKKKEGLPWNL